MIEFLKTLPAIIKEASKTRLGILSLMTLLLFFITLVFFHDEGTLVKMLIFFLLFLGIILFGFSIHSVEIKKQGMPEDQMIIGSAKKNAKLEKYNSLHKHSRYIIGGLIFASVTSFTAYSAFWQEQYLFYKSHDRTKKHWIGLNEITASEANHRKSYFRFTLQGRLGRLKSVECLNGSGGISTDKFHDVFANMLIKECSEIFAVKVDFLYDEHGNISKETFIDQAGNKLLHIRYLSESALLKFEFDNGASCSKGKSNVTTAEVEYYSSNKNPDRIKSIRFYNDEKTPMPDENISFGYEFDYNTEGKMSIKSPINVKGMRFNVSEEYKYDDKGNVTEKSYWTNDGKRAFYNGVSKILYDYDDYGNFLSKSYFDDGNNPTYNDKGYYSIHSQYDAMGNEIIESYHNANGKLMTSIQGYAFEKKVFDERGNNIEVRLYNTDSTLGYISTKGYSIRKATFDEFQRKTSNTHFDENEKPILTYEGYHQEKLIFDKAGYMTEIRYSGVDGKLKKNINGFAVMKNEFDSKGRRIQISFLDEQRKLCHDYTAGVAILSSKFNSASQLTEISYYNKFGQPTTRLGCDVPYFLERNMYNPSGLLEKQIYLDVDSTYDKYNKYSIIHYRYDEKARMIEETYFSKPSEPIASQKGLVMVKYEYNDLDQRVKVYYQNKNGQPDNTGEYNVTKHEYDLWGREIRVIYYNISGAEDDQLKTVAMDENEYNRFGRPKETKYLKYNDDVIEEGIFTNFRYDERGYVVETSETITTHITHTENRVITKFEKDRYGRDTTVSYYGSDNMPVLNDDKVHKEVLKHDENGFLTKVSYYDADLKLTAHIEGHSSVQYRVDEVGNVLENQYFDRENNPMKRFGVSYFTYRYDDKGLEVFRGFLDEKKNLIKNSVGIAQIIQKYNVAGRMISKSYYDENMNPVQTSNGGFHKTEYTYDKDANEVEIRYDLNGTLVAKR